MKNWIKHCHGFSGSLIDSYKRKLEQQPGLFLIVGGAFLKSGSLLETFTLVLLGYILLIQVIGIYIKKWRDRK
jgi:hypothetical protein